MTKKQLYWEDVEVGSEIPALPKTATSQMLVKWAGATGDFNPLHYEFAFAQAQGVGKPIVHGTLKRAWLIQMLTGWIGERGFIRNLSCQYRAVDYPVFMKSLSEPAENKITHWCKGKVTGKGEEGGECYVECEVWVENEKGEVTTPGKAKIILPSRKESRAC